MTSGVPEGVRNQLLQTIIVESRPHGLIIDSVPTGGSDERTPQAVNDTPGCVRHVKGDTFSEVYLSYY